MKMSDIFYPKPVTNEEKKFFYYTIIGKQTAFDDSNNPVLADDTPEVLAKKIVSEEKTRYFIKIGPYGKIYNPIGMFSEGRSNKFLKRTGKMEWSFKEVNSRVFDFYLSFLRTKNIAHLNIAERELN